MPTMTPLGDAALLITLGDRIDPDINARVHALAARIRARQYSWLRALVPAYASLTVHYDPVDTGWRADTAAWSQLTELLAPLLVGRDNATDAGRLINVPVCYGGVAGPDLAAVAAHAGLTEADVIARHTAAEYRVYFLGFMPGFPYLGGLDPTLATPRLATPRTQVPAGSVAIGGAQTGIYPLASPGGWRLIGLTPLRLFDPAREPPCLLRAGDRLRFTAIDAAAFASLAGAPPC